VKQWCHIEEFDRRGAPQAALSAMAALEAVEDPDDRQSLTDDLSFTEWWSVERNIAHCG
jgi:hypothetical protein